MSFTGKYGSALVIRARGNRYVVEDRDEDGRKFQVRPADYGMRTPTERHQAVDLAERHQARHRYGRSVGEYAERFTTRKYDLDGRPITEQTNLHNERQIAPFLQQYADKAMGEITVQQASDFASHHESSVREVKAMFNAAAAEEWIELSPFRNIKPRQRKGKQTEGRFVPTLPEVEAVLEACLSVHGEYGWTLRAMCAMCAWGGLRPGEAAGARSQDLDLDARRYNVQGQWHTTLGRWTEPKNGSTGNVYLFPPAIEALGHIDTSRHYLFPAKRGGMIGKTQINNYLVPVRQIAGVPNLTMHSFRHFHLSYLYNHTDLPLKTIAEQARHKDGGALILSTYGHPDHDAHIDKIAAAVEGATDGESHGPIARF